MRYVVIALVALPILVLALVGLRYLVRGTPVRRMPSAGLHEAGVHVSDPDFHAVLELLSHVRLTEGNSVELLCCGDETYPLLFADLAAARESITLQMYYCRPGKVADQLHATLVDRARAGVRVLFLLDAFGSQDLTEEYVESLKRAGVEVAQFRPVQWYALEKAYNRSHIRVVVVDSRIAYTGGFGIDDKWLGDGRHADQWRDTNVRFTGPSVRALQATFAAGWAEATGDLLTGEPFFENPADGRDSGANDDAGEDKGDYDEVARPDVGDGARVVRDVRAGVMHCAPTVGSTIAERFLALVIGGAQRTLWITNGYFVPPAGMVDLLVRVAERGVDVRVLAAGPSTDVRSTRFAGRASFERLLGAGVRIWEYQPTMVHAKTIVADGALGAVGTMNFDNRSLAFNDESNLVFHDPRLGEALHRVFDEDLAYAQEVTLAAFRARPWTERVQERAFSMLTRIL